MAIEISIVIVSREKRELLGRSVDALIAQNFPKQNYEIIIVDDGSAKENLKSLVLEKKKVFPNLKYLRQKPSGLSAGRNLGAKNATAKIVAFTDNDVIASPQWVKEINAAFVSGVVGVEGKITTDFPRKLFTNAPENLQGGLYIGANSAYLKNIIEKAGRYDEKMNFWREDTDFAFRAMKFGKIVFASNAIIHHPLRNDSPLSTLRYLSFLKNEWIMLFRHGWKFFNFSKKSVAKDWLKSIGVGIIIPISGILFFEYGAIVTIGFDLFIFLCSGLVYKKIFNTETFVTTLYDAYLFAVLTLIKYFLYPFYLVYGLFDALLFMVRK